MIPPERDHQPLQQNLTIATKTLPRPSPQYGGLAVLLWQQDLYRTDAKKISHLLIFESLARSIRLHPCTVDDELRNSALTRLPDHLIGGAGRLFNINLFKRNVVPGEPAFGNMAIATPWGSIDQEFHNFFSDII